MISQPSSPEIAGFLLVLSPQFPAPVEALSPNNLPGNLTAPVYTLQSQFLSLALKNPDSFSHLTVIIKRL